MFKPKHVKLGPTDEPYDNILFDRFKSKVKTTKLKLFIRTLKDNYGIYCEKCCRFLPIYRFSRHSEHHNGLRRYCMKCQYNGRNIFQRILTDMKSNSKTKKFKVPEFTKKSIKDMFWKQRGRCFYSNIQMELVRDMNCPFAISAERLDSKRGYEVGNVVLIIQCLQFQQQIDVQQYITQRFNVDFDESYFMKMKMTCDNIARVRKFKGYRKKSLNGDYQCTLCNEITTRFSRYNKSACESCVDEFNQKDKASDVRFLRQKLHDAKRHAEKKRRNIHRHCENHEVNLTIQEVIDKIIEQKGVCALSGNMLSYTNNRCRQLSLDRLDNSKGYTKDNIQLICAPWNTKARPTKDQFITIRESTQKLIEEQSYI